jgi:hypothetical protein
MRVSLSLHDGKLIQIRLDKNPVDNSLLSVGLAAFSPATLTF